MKHTFLLYFLFICSFGFSQDILLHSHNDYLQKHPLKTALEYKANSIEVDVAWYKNQIKVCHIPIGLKRKPDLETLYLKPMLEQKAKLSSVSILMIDIKTGGTEILNALNHLIKKYNTLFTSRSENNSNKIKVVISGHFGRQELLNNKEMDYLFVDGGPGELGKGFSSYLMPWISTNYAGWSEKERIELIERAHKENKKVRFWNTNDTKRSWKKLTNYSVDIIGVDHLKRFTLFNNK